MDSLREHLEQTDKDSFRMEHQLVAHSKMLACCAATAYGELYYTKEKEIREYNGFDIIEKGVLIQAPRRNGKTETIVRFVAASLLCIPSFTVLVIAASKGAADNKTGILFLLKSFLTRIFGVTDFEYSNENTLQFRVAGNLRKVVSLSAEVGNRCVLFARCP
jgi:hypothetical protein